jgi:hypothetical protein
MRQKGTSISERGGGCLEFVIARIEQALASFAEAEMNLRNLRVSCLPRVAESLAAAAAEVESLRSALPPAGYRVRNAASVRAGMKRLEYAAGRVSALHQAANDFHAGLMHARQRELAEYDALGGVCGSTGCHVQRHCLEARG